MADKKRKNRDNSKKNLTKPNKYSKKRKNSSNEKPKGPRLPNALRKEIEVVVDDVEIDSDEEAGDDVYEYEEAVAEEETRKNKRYDPVESFEYQLPEGFDDENVASDDDSDDDDDDGEIEDQYGDGDKHSRMLQQITGLPVEAFSGRKQKNDQVVTEAYPESEFNPTRDILDGDGRITIQDLLTPLHQLPGFGDLRKSVLRTGSKSMALPAPLPKSDREKVDRRVAYECSKKIITKWEQSVKLNREAPTLYFDGNTDVGFSTVGAIASEFEPRTEFEKKMASILNDNDVKEAHKNDGARLLELNKISVEDVKERQNRLAKMRSLLFRHEIKAKRVKKIKSKTYHRLQKKDRLKASAAGTELDPEAAKKIAMQQEFNRAEERLTLKHKNSGRWAQRILQRGLDAQDEGTRAALADQLHQNALLTRKMHSLKESSSDESSDDDDNEDFSDNSDHERELRVLEKAKEKTIGVMEEDDEKPNSGVLSLPFMVRGLQKRKEAANEEAKLALEEYDSSLKQLDDEREGTNVETGNTSSRRVFGAPKKNVVKKSSNGIKVDNYYGNSDSEDNLEGEEGNDDVIRGGDRNFQKDVNIDLNLLREESEIGHDSLFKSFNDLVKNPGPKTTHEVAMLASDSWRKMSREDNIHAISDKEGDANAKSSSKVDEPLDNQDSESDKLYSKTVPFPFTSNQAFDISIRMPLGKDFNPATAVADLQRAEVAKRAGVSIRPATYEVEEVENGSDSDSEGQMVDGILSAGAKSSYKLPSQAELIRSAFAGDDVEDEFEKDKEEVLNEENPEPEKPVLLPGWGQWSNVQRKKGLPSWMVQEHESAKKKREEALSKRKDAHLKNVIISQKLDKKSDKLYSKTVPFPFTSNQAFETSIRMPLGKDFNPTTAVAYLQSPEVVKRAGVSIQPITHEDVDPYVREEKEGGRNGGKQKKKKNVAKFTKNMRPKTIKA